MSALPKILSEGGAKQFSRYSMDDVKSLLAAKATLPAWSQTALTVFEQYFPNGEGSTGVAPIKKKGTDLESPFVVLIKHQLKSYAALLKVVGDRTAAVGRQRDTAIAAGLQNQLDRYRAKEYVVAKTVEHMQHMINLGATLAEVTKEGGGKKYEIGLKEGFQSSPLYNLRDLGLYDGIATELGRISEGKLLEYQFHFDDSVLDNVVAQLHEQDKQTAEAVKVLSAATSAATQPAVVASEPVTEAPAPRQPINLVAEVNGRVIAEQAASAAQAAANDGGDTTAPSLDVASAPMVEPTPVAVTEVDPIAAMLDRIAKLREQFPKDFGPLGEPTSTVVKAINNLLWTKPVIDRFVELGGKLGDNGQGRFDLVMGMIEKLMLLRENGVFKLELHPDERRLDIMKAYTYVREQAADVGIARILGVGEDDPAGVSVEPEIPATQGEAVQPATAATPEITEGTILSDGGVGAVDAIPAEDNDGVELALSDVTHVAQHAHDGGEIVIDMPQLDELKAMYLNGAGDGLRSDLLMPNGEAFVQQLDDISLALQHDLYAAALKLHYELVDGGHIFKEPAKQGEPTPTDGRVRLVNLVTGQEEGSAWADTVPMEPKDFLDISDALASDEASQTVPAEPAGAPETAADMLRQDLNSLMEYVIEDRGAGGYRYGPVDRVLDELLEETAGFIDGGALEAAEQSFDCAAKLNSLRELGVKKAEDVELFIERGPEGAPLYDEADLNDLMTAGVWARVVTLSNAQQQRPSLMERMHVGTRVDALFTAAAAMVTGSAYAVGVAGKVLGLAVSAAGKALGHIPSVAMSLAGNKALRKGVVALAGLGIVAGIGFAAYSSKGLLAKPANNNMAPPAAAAAADKAAPAASATVAKQAAAKPAAQAAKADEPKPLSRADAKLMIIVAGDAVSEAFANSKKTDVEIYCKAFNILQGAVELANNNHLENTVVAKKNAADLAFLTGLRDADQKRVKEGYSYSPTRFWSRVGHAINVNCAPK